ncbi:MAG: Gfo/Idh/MocA family oxidoreductase [Ferruginibacter sp.]|nr:Gfo/Idh/MocA family oxidoreductase [Ferruginibacter sp.]
MQYNFAITGCGRISQRHAEQISRIGNVKAVCDIIPERANFLASKYGSTAYYSLEQLLTCEKEIDIISICTPNGLHTVQSIQSLEAGIHVICEKPLCIHTSDGHKMIDAALAASKKLFVVKSTRYNPVVEAVKILLDDNKLGKIYSFQLNCVWNRPAAYYADTWKGTLLLDGGTLFTQFSHYIDVLLWFLGEAADVKGYRKNAAHGKSIEFEDTGVLAVQMLSGAIGSIHYSVNATDKNQEVSLTIVAAKGTIKLGGEFMNEIVYQQPILVDAGQISTGNPANDYGFYKGSMSNHDKVYENVMLALSGEKSSVTDGTDALKTVSFIEKIYQQIHL